MACSSRFNPSRDNSLHNFESVSCISGKGDPKTSGDPSDLSLIYCTPCGRTLESSILLSGPGKLGRSRRGISSAHHFALSTLHSAVAMPRSAHLKRAARFGARSLSYAVNDNDVGSCHKIRPTNIQSSTGIQALHTHKDRYGVLDVYTTRPSLSLASEKGSGGIIRSTGIGTLRP
jgi:hypothetical protein